MRVLIVNPASYIHEDIVTCLRGMYGKAAIEEYYYVFKGKDIYDNDEFATGFEKKLSESEYSFVMSTNFYPVVAQVCYDRKIKYLAWTYDTPMNVLPCTQMEYETNYIFLFDRIELKKYQAMGYTRFFHMPLGVDTNKYERFKPEREYEGDVTFMGKLYRSQVPIIKQGLSEELVAFIDKLVSVQGGVRENFIVDELISAPIIDEINRQYQEAGRDMTLVKEQLSYAIAEQVTYYDRVTLLEMMGRRFDTHLYTYDIGEAEKSVLKHVKIHGVVDYFTKMPVLFKSCKINLNSSLRAAQSAISLRALDVLGCGGFLLSNAQPELMEYFEDKKEVVLFHSTEEAIDLANYYLTHDEERKRIAVAGLERVRKDFRYDRKIKEMLKLADITD